jgi:WD40 repeat protein
MLTLAAPVRRLDAVAFSPDGRELAAGGSAPDGPGVHLWDRGSPTTPRRLLDGYTIHALGYAADGRLVVGAAFPTAEALGGGVLVLDPRAPAGRLDPLPGRVQFAVAGDRLLTTTVGRTAAGWRQVVGCRRLLADGFRPLWGTTLEGDAMPGWQALLPDGRAAVLTWDFDGGPIRLTLTLRAADDGRELAAVTPPARTVGPLVADPAGEWLVHNAGGSLYVWRLADLQAPPVKITFGKKHCTGAGFLPSGQLLAAGNDGTVRRLDPATGATAATYAFTAGRVRSLAVAPDGVTAAVGTDRGAVVVFDLD